MYIFRIQFIQLSLKNKQTNKQIFVFAHLKLFACVMLAWTTPGYLPREPYVSAFEEEN